MNTSNNIEQNRIFYDLHWRQTSSEAIKLTLNAGAEEEDELSGTEKVIRSYTTTGKTCTILSVLAVYSLKKHITK